MQQLRLQTIAILSLVFCGSAAAYQETPELSLDPKASGTSTPSSFETFDDKLKQDSDRSSISSPALKERLVREANLMIAWSEQQDELRGFSATVGDWDVLKIPPQKSIVPTLSISVAVVELEGSIAGFSATNCYWDVIEIPKGVRAETIVHADMVTVQTPDHLYTFAAEKGQWTSPTDPDLQPVYEKIPLSNAKPALYDQFQKWLDSLPKHQARGLRFGSGGGDSRLLNVNASRQSLLKAAKQKLTEWGYIGDGSTAQPSPGNLAANLKSKNSNTSSPAPASTSSVDELRVELENLEAKIVDQLRGNEDTQDSTTKLAELRPQAEKAFDLRQQVLRLEAQRLQAKLKSIQESLQAREKNRDDLVSKRLKELGSSAPKNEWSSSKEDELSKGVLEELQKAEIELAMQQQKLAPTHPKIFSLQEKIAVLRSTLDKRAHPVAGSNQVSRRDLQSPELPATNASSTIVQASGNYFEQVTSIAKTLRAIRHSVVQTREELNRCDQEIKDLDSQLEAFAEKITNGNLGKGLPQAEAQKEGLQSKRVVKVESRKYLGQTLELEMKTWQQAWKSYDQQVDLLNLEVEKKQNDLESLIKVEDDTRILFNNGRIEGSKLTEAERQVKRAKIELQQATQIRQLFGQIVADEPELNPDHGEK